MMPTVLQDNVFTALRAFILTLVTCPVIRTQANRVAMPVGAFVAMTQMTGAPLSTNVHTYDAAAQTQSILRPEQFAIQVDCYGAGSGDTARMIATLLRDTIATDFFATTGFDIEPLFAGDAKQIPLTDGEQQYEERWTFDAQLQINPVMTTAQQSATSLTIGLDPIDQTFAP